MNLAGGLQLDETNLISTTALSAAATANNVIYSTTARTNVAYRVVGFIDITEATAGTWATAPSEIQGVGGQALTGLSSIGYGQTWQTVTRTSATTYYNTTGKPITWEIGVNVSSTIAVTINGYAFPLSIATLANIQIISAFIIPPNQSYSYTAAAGSAVHSELR